MPSGNKAKILSIYLFCIIIITTIVDMPKSWQNFAKITKKTKWTHQKLFAVSMWLKLVYSFIKLTQFPYLYGATPKADKQSSDLFVASLPNKQTEKHK